MGDQSELTRRRRLYVNGACPTHGVGLVPYDVICDEWGEPEAQVVQCPRRDCSFTITVHKGDKLDKVLNSCVESKDKP